MAYSNSIYRKNTVSEECENISPVAYSGISFHFNGYITGYFRTVYKANYRHFLNSADYIHEGGLYAGDYAIGYEIANIIECWVVHLCCLIRSISIILRIAGQAGLFSLIIVEKVMLVSFLCLLI